MSYVQARPYENLVDLRDRARDEVGKVVVGQGDAVDLLLVAALAQRRNRQRNDLQAEIQILAERLRLHRALEIVVRR